MCCLVCGRELASFSGASASIRAMQERCEPPVTLAVFKLAKLTQTFRNLRLDAPKEDSFRQGLASAGSIEKEVELMYTPSLAVWIWRSHLGTGSFGQVP